MPDLEPITRDEMLWSGEDLEPITRREMYIKHLYDETQVIPDKPITREEMFILKAGEELHDVTIEQLTATENRTYSESGKAYSPVIVNVQPNVGNINIPSVMPNQEITRNASQEGLDGYSSVTVKGAILPNAMFDANGTYTATEQEGGWAEVVVDVPLPDNAYLLKDIPATPASIATFTDGSALPMPKLEIAVEPQQSGSGDPSPDNIRPISGWSAVDVSVRGVNVWDEEWEQGVISITTGQNVSGNGIRSKNYSNCKGNTSYYFSVRQTADYIMWYDKDKNFINHTYADSSKVVTSPSNAYYFKIRIDSISTYSNNVSVNYPSTDTSYHAYNGQTITIQLGDTYYGGKLDVVSGVMTVDRVGIDMGSLTWVYEGFNNRFYVLDVASLIKLPGDSNIPNMICSQYLCVSYIVGNSSGSNNVVFVGTPSGRVYAKDSRYTSASDFKTAVTGQQLVYELATPTTIQLTPTQVSSLMGVNNIFANTGNILDGQYFGKEA